MRCLTTFAAILWLACTVPATAQSTWVSPAPEPVPHHVDTGFSFNDAVVAGHDRYEVGLLVFPNPAGAAKIAGLDPATSLPELVGNKKVCETLREGLAAYNAKNPGSSTRISRVLLLKEPPDIDANEITDKGYINQRAVLEKRNSLVETLFSDNAEVVLIP